jgi:hypothetical protein
MTPRKVSSGAAGTASKVSAGYSERRSIRGADGEPGGGIAALALQVVHPGRGGFRGGLGLAQLRRGGDALLGKALSLRRGGDGPRGRLLLCGLFCRPSPFRLLHLLTCGSVLRRSGGRKRQKGGSEKGGDGEAGAKPEEGGG